MQFYDEKQEVYFTNPRLDLIKLIPHNPAGRILEIGAGGGDTLVEIKKHDLAREVVGVDIMTIPNSNQDNPVIDKFIICDVEKDMLPYSEGYFDVILLGDVVEHLFDPWSFLSKIASLLKKDGTVIASLPNIRHYSAMSKVFFKGDFGYESQGLFDKTHFRFFCKKNMLALFNTDSLKHTYIVPRNTLLGLKGKKELLNKLTFRLFEEFFTIQYIIVARKL
jgi:2-polyprenyl-3-methyl-5-hydroxy-6-metoxy-1,4-benzoquinol methylase